MQTKLKKYLSLFIHINYMKRIVRVQQIRRTDDVYENTFYKK